MIWQVTHPIQLSVLLDQYRTAREERHAGTSRRAQASAGLLVVGIQQRLLSSTEAFAPVASLCIAGAGEVPSIPGSVAEGNRHAT